MEREIIKIGSLEPDRFIQDGVLVYSIGGVSPAIRARDYKGPIKVIVNGSKSNRTDGQHDRSYI